MFLCQTFYNMRINRRFMGAKGPAKPILWKLFQVRRSLVVHSNGFFPGPPAEFEFSSPYVFIVVSLEKKI
jgi:hypothetical protein